VTRTDIEHFLQGVPWAQQSIASFFPFYRQIDTKTQLRSPDGSANISLNTLLHFFSPKRTG